MSIPTIAAQPEFQRAEKIVMRTCKTFDIGLAMSALTTTAAFAQDSTGTCYHEPRVGAFATQPWNNGTPYEVPQDRSLSGTPAQAPSVTAHPRDRHVSPGFALRANLGLRSLVLPTGFALLTTEPCCQPAAWRRPQFAAGRDIVRPSEPT